MSAKPVPRAERTRAAKRIAAESVTEQCAALKVNGAPPASKRKVGLQKLMIFCARKSSTSKSTRAFCMDLDVAEMLRTTNTSPRMLAFRELSKQNINMEIRRTLFGMHYIVFDCSAFAAKIIKCNKWLSLQTKQKGDDEKVYVDSSDDEKRKKKVLRSHGKKANSGIDKADAVKGSADDGEFLY